MTLYYRARLSLEATVPEDTSIEPFLKASVEFPIWCPKCGPFRTQLKKNGFDTNHSAHPQLFYCKRHHLQFYAHTSWICQQLSAVVFERIVADLFEKKIPIKAVAMIHQISPSLISQIRYYFQEALAWKLAQLQQKRLLLQQQPNLPVPLDDAIYWDETFFRVGKVSWALILIIDAHGRPLAWKFSQHRNVAIYSELLQAIRSQLPTIPIFIGDGWNAYQKACLELRQECFLIEHLHSHPWKYVRLHHFEFNAETKETSQNSIEIPYNSFTQNHPQKGHALQRTHIFKNPKTSSKKRGRPLGSKDRVKRHSKYFPNPRKPKRPAKKRGRKSVRTHGRPFYFHPRPVPIGWQIQWLELDSNSAQELIPPISEVELLLDVTYKVMKGKNIQSNRIESVNRVLKDITPRRGLKGAEQVEAHLDSYLRLWSNTIKGSAFETSPTIPLKSATGFARIMRFFKPQIEAIQIQITK